MSGAPVAERAARLAAAVARLDDPGWAERVAAMAGDAAAAQATGPPTYRDVAVEGTGLVAALAGDGRWEEAAREARELKRFFAATPAELGPVVHEAFDGLLAASLARDRDELADFVELVEAMFP